MAFNAPFFPIQESVVGMQTKPTVDGRLLHEYLEVHSRFNDWIVRRIEQYGWLEDIDFTCYSNLSRTEKDYGPVAAIEYHLTFDMAKELCMVENTAQGRAARKYFIACEAALRDVFSAASQIKTYLLPGYVGWKKKFPDAYWVEVCRVYGFPAPHGTSHSPGCRGVTFKYVYGALPPVVQEALIQNNPYQPDGRTRPQRHHQWLTPERIEDFLFERIRQVMTTLRGADDRRKDMFKAALARHDRRHGIEIQISPLLRHRLAALDTEQLWLFDPLLKESFHG